MKKYILSLSLIFSLITAVYSQIGLDSVLKEIEKNNTSLAAFKKNLDASQIENKTGIFLENPELEFNYLWGDPSSIGSRTDLSISQAFDFPTAYKYRKQISETKNSQLDSEYQKYVRDILLKTRLVYTNLVFYNALKTELEKRNEHAQEIADAYKAKFEAGETNILEYNKAQLNLLNAANSLRNTELEKNSLQAELIALNGGKKIDVTTSTFEEFNLGMDFETWYLEAEKNNPELSWLNQEIDIKNKEEKLNRALALPKFQAGYMSETVIGEKFQGLTLGLAIPLWENKNKVKQSIAQTQALKSMEHDTKTRFYNALKILYTKASEQQKNIREYQSAMVKFDNADFLKKALDNGEITLIEYMLELSLYYDSINSELEMKRDLNQTIAKLYQLM